MKRSSFNPASVLAQMKTGRVFLLSTLAVVIASFIPARQAQAAAESVLYSFSAFTEGNYPESALVRGTDGNFYGTTNQGGTSGYGTVFQLTPAGVLTTLHSFTSAEGGGPTASLTQGSDGNFYGTTNYGGNQGNGTAYRITPSGSLTVIHSFTSSEGGEGLSKLLQGNDGNFYGTASYDSSHGYGDVYRMTPAGVVTVLYSFSATDANNVNTDGASPQGGVIQGSDGNFYGTTRYGGFSGDGTVFQLTPAGVLTTLHSFGGTDGTGPTSALVQGSNGVFYGTTTYGGSNFYGNFFQITSAGVLTTLHSFASTADGAYPVGDLLLGSDGNFYGVTNAGGSGGHGTVYQMTSTGTPTVLHNFASGEGQYSQAGLIQNTDGSFYGTASSGGANDLGSIFRVTSAGVFTSLHDFANRNSDGAASDARLIQGSDGNFYGTTSGGGANGYGTIFRLTPAGALTNLYSFTAGSDGSEPQSDLIQGTDGNFYGTTEYGGTNGYGTAFRLTPAGVLTTIHRFTYADGAYPIAALVLANDGNFYGTTSDGGSYFDGTVFRMTTAGAITTLHSFGSSSGYEDPSGNLIQGSDGNFYGTTVFGGTNGQGAVYQLTPAGVFTTLYSFTTPDTYGRNPDGYAPNAGVIQGSDGNFYGTAGSGGTYGQGTLFQLTPAGVLTTLHSFSALVSQSTNIEGAGPDGSLLQGTDGAFYGVTAGGGLNGSGAVFRCTSTGTLTALYSFSDSTGGDPRAGLLQASDSNFYGTVSSGGAFGNGAVYEIPLSATTTTPPVITSATAATFQAGTVFSYQITASGSPTSFLTTGLPYGLSVNATTGLISGTTVTAGTYSITLGATNAGGTGTATLTLTISPGTPPANDNFANAQLLTGASGSVTGSNLYATLETGESNIGAASVWYLWTAPTTNAVNFNTYGSRFDTVLGVYTGAAVNALTLVASNDDYYSDDTSSVNFSAQAGTTYAIVVDGYDASEYGNIVLSWTQVSGTSVPAISSPGTASAVVNQAFSYQIVASNSPSNYTAANLPSGLSVNPTTGLISGASYGVGTFTVTLTASNANGTGTATLTLTVNTVTVAAPVISSSSTATTTAGQAFSYQIVASNTPTSYNATGLPASLNVNPSTGLITGSVVQAGTYPISLSATNAGGTGTLVLTLTVNAAIPSAPVISSTLTASATSGAAFSYQITASNTPTSFAAVGLPPGLSVSATTGLISGAPTSPGMYSVALSATNAGGTGTVTLTLTVSAPPVLMPVISSAASASGQITLPFTYQITASNAPVSFGATGLPAGLTVSAGGLISGTPTQAGTFAVNLSATNTGGTGTSTLTLTVAPAPVIAPVVSSVLEASVQAGDSFSYQITASNSPTGFSATPLPTGLGVDATSGLIAGTPTQAGTYNIALSASNSGGTGTATLVLIVTPALPVATLAATVPNVTAGTGEIAEFTLSLSAAQTTDTVVDFVIKGTAVNGTEYVLLKASKKIKAGKTSKPIKITPLGDGVGPGVKRTVILTLQPGTGYTVGTTGKVKVKIFGQ